MAAVGYVGSSPLLKLAVLELKALSTDDTTLELIAYDDRLAAGARANGLTVLRPGRARR